MEKRKAKINISKAGGTAGKDAKTYKVTLPISWMKALEISQEDREIELSFDGKTITLSRTLSGTEFARHKQSIGHDVRKFSFYEVDKLCTTIYADFSDETLIAENHIDDPVKTAFGNNTLPDWADFQEFLEDRCIPRERAGLREYLEVLNLTEYNPLEIIQKTKGRMAEDQQWLEMEVLS